MDVNAINPILASFTEVLPLLGFSKVTKKKVSLAGSTLAYDGILLNVAVVGSIKGVLLLGMSFEDAKKFASNMMMGMEVLELDSLAQSAISELANMLTANSATNLSQMGIEVDISTPILTIGDGFTLKISNDKYICIEMLINSQTVEINVSIS